METEYYIKKLLLVLFAGFTGFTTFAQNYYQVYTKDGGLAQQASDQINKVAVEGNNVQFYQTGVPGTPVYSKAVALVDSITILPYIPIVNPAEAATTIPAENCTEGWQLTNAVDWLLFNGYIVLGGADGISQLTASYRTYFTDDGIYNLNLKGATWGTTATISIYVDNKLTKLIPFPQKVNDDPSLETSFWTNLGEISVTKGMHTIKFLYNLGSAGGVLDFDKFTISAILQPVVSQATPVTIEAETCTEGYGIVDRSSDLNWLTGWPSTIYTVQPTPPPAKDISYPIYVRNAGKYDFKLWAITWSSDATIDLYIDGNIVTTVAMSKIDYVLDNPFVFFNNIELPSGNHVIKFVYNSSGNELVFDKFTITTIPLPIVSQAAPVTIESDACTEGYSAVMPIDWLFNNQSYIILGENEPASYYINVTDAGSYDFKLNVATWASNASIGLYIDNNTSAAATIPISKIDYTIDNLFVSLNNVTLPSGNHVITFKLLNPEGQTLNFNNFTITYHP